MLTGNNGVLTQGKRAKEEQAHAAVKEGFMLLYNEYKTKQEVNASKVQEKTKVASTELVKIAENSGAEGTTENLGSFKDFIQSKNIISADGIINVRNLLGQTLSLGNGTSKESGDVYVFEEQDDYYNLMYYNKQIQQAKIYQIKNENAGEKLIATHYFDSNTGSRRIIKVNFKRNDYEIWAQNILNGKTPEEKEKIFLDGVSYQDIKNGDITEPYKSFQDFSDKWFDGNYETFEDFINESPFDSVDECLIEYRWVNPKEYDQLWEWEKGLVTGTITCPDGSKVEVSETNNYESIEYPISQPGTYTFTAVTSNGVVSEINVKAEEKYTLIGIGSKNSIQYITLINGFKGINITSENKPKAKYTVDSVEQEVDLTESIDNNGTINFWNSKLYGWYYENVEVTVEIDGKQIKWKGNISAVPK